MTIAARLSELGIELPTPAAPAGAYLPAVKSGSYVYTAGQIPLQDGAVRYKGKVGAEVSLTDGYAAARLCAINALSAIKHVIGDLDQVVRVVKVVGFVNSAPGFSQQPQVINGASEFLAEVFGSNGQHARSAVGVAELPLDSAVEVELIVEIR